MDFVTLSLTSILIVARFMFFYIKITSIIFVKPVRKDTITTFGLALVNLVLKIAKNAF